MLHDFFHLSVISLSFSLRWVFLCSCLCHVGCNCFFFSFSVSVSFLFFSWPLFKFIPVSCHVAHGWKQKEGNKGKESECCIFMRVTLLFCSVILLRAGVLLRGIEMRTTPGGTTGYICNNFVWHAKFIFVFHSSVIYGGKELCIFSLPFFFLSVVCNVQLSLIYNERCDKYLLPFFSVVAGDEEARCSSKLHLICSFTQQW